jgi:hypothetical protein
MTVCAFFATRVAYGIGLAAKLPFLNVRLLPTQSKDGFVLFAHSLKTKRQKLEHTHHHIGEWHFDFCQHDLCVIGPSYIDLWNFQGQQQKFQVSFYFATQRHRLKWAFE